MARARLPKLESRVKALRRARGLSQAELARRAGITRQALSAIEAGRYAPSVTVALRLAHVLGCQVEDLFHLSMPPDLTSLERLGSSPAFPQRLAIARVRGRWIGYPLEGDHAFQEELIPADGLWAGPDQWTWLRPLDQLERAILLLGCDPALGLLIAYVAQRRPEVRIRWLGASSVEALEALRCGHVHIAGSHLPDPEGGDYNVRYARQALAGVGGLLVTFATWELGFVVPRGNPKGLRSVADLARPDVRIVNREPGSGSRALLEDLLARSGLTPKQVNGYETAVRSHLGVAQAVASGGADTGISLRVAACACDLDFIPLAEARFDLIIPRDLLAHPAVVALLDALQDRAFRAELAALPGYDGSRTGTVVAEIPASGG